MATQYQLVPPGVIIQLSRDEEAAMCMEVAKLEQTGQGYAAYLLKRMYDLDEVWIWEAKEELLAERNR